ncbi:AEC family transporter [Demequina globuliformis]|uniref:AEC family transporter n=1 Tax=Demequina globuliformis TaxID=676202 RepID=UPI00078389D1|nr:AEC family transporter [Demequina globuliformis]
MIDVVVAIATMAAVAVAGWLIQARRWLPAGSRELLATVVFTIAGPSLLLATVAQADLARLASTGAAVTWGTTLVMAILLAVAARWGMRLAAGRATVTVLSGAYVNAGNLGIPLAVYMFGDALAVVPTMLVQLLLMGPVSFAILDRAADAGGLASAAPGRRSLARTVLGNPLTIATLLGLALALLPWQIPPQALAPFELVGAAAPPLALLTLGMALVTTTSADAGGTAAATPQTGERRNPEDATVPGGTALAPVIVPVIVATVARTVIHPALAWAIGSAAGLTGEALAIVVAMAALPTAQNVVVFATRYRCAIDVASRACLVTTLCCGPVLIAISALLA